MAIYYIDPEGGNDANDGLSFANRKKVTLPTLAAGDTLRWIASPDPTSLGSATWTNGSTITLGSARTVDLYQDGSWSAATNVTATTSTTRKEGTNCASLAIASGFTTGRIGHYATGTKDCSAHTKVFFWIRTSVAVADMSIFQLKLCSDTGGATAVDTLTLPAIKSLANTWVPILLDNGAALGSAIESVALYATSDPGTVTLLVDNVFATSDISPFGVISKSSTANPDFSAGDEPWWPIRSVAGTTVTLESGSFDSSASTASPGYYGTTESVTTHFINPIAYPSPATASATQIYNLTISGTAGSPITFSGGWNRTDMSTQTGLSWMNARNGGGYFFITSTRSYLDFDRLGLVYVYQFLNTTSSSANFTISNCHVVGTVHYGFSLIATAGPFSVSNCSAIGGANGFSIDLYKSTLSYCRTHLNTSQGFLATACGAVEVVDGIFTDGNTNGIVRNVNSLLSLTRCEIARGNVGLSVNAGQMEVVDCSISNATSSAITCSSGDVDFVNLTTSGNAKVFALSTTITLLYLYNWIYDEALIATFETPFDEWIISHNEDGVAGSTVLRTDSGMVESQTTVRHTASGVAWKLSPTGTIRDVDYPLAHRIGPIFVESGVATTISVWLRRTHTDLTGTLRIKDKRLTGIAETSATMTAAADTWEQVSISFTPTDTGFVFVQVEAYGGTTHSLYWDDLTVSPVSTLDASSGDYGHYQRGVMLTQHATGGSPTAIYSPFAA